MDGEIAFSANVQTIRSSQDLSVWTSGKKHFTSHLKGFD